MANIWQKKTGTTPGPTNTIKAYNPVVKAPVKKKIAVPAYNPLAPLNFNQYKTQTASINDIGKKYGIDYSREYAARQAEAEAQAKRIGLNNQSKQVDLGVKNAQDAVSRDYFQKGLEGAQAQVNGGINAGLSNEANLRLSMNRQATTADIFRQANLQKNEIGQNLTQVEVARKAQEEQIYQERLAQALQVAMDQRRIDQSEAQAIMNAALQQRGQAIDMDQFTKNMAWDKSKFGQQMAWDKSQFGQQMAWDKFQFQNLSASDQEANKIAYARLEEEKRQFNSDAEWRKYTYDNMSAYEKRQMDQSASQFGEDMAWKQYEMEYTSEMALAEAQATAGGAGAGGGYLNFLP